MDSGEWDRRWQERALGGHLEPSELLAREVAGLRAGRALDLACGAGCNAIWLADRGWRVTAVDFSPVALVQAGELAQAAEVDWVLADLRTYEPPKGAFELALVLYLHVPVQERRSLLARAAAALAPAGMLLVVGHDLANLGTGAAGPRDPQVLYTPDDIASELPELVIERAERVTRTVETEDGPTEAIDAFVRAVSAAG